ncbi:hypothetical protein FRB91_008956 [Serendipita sp. 411]|nr:hypothetical protein FRB91_008956 [Serendipita sp. 411]
MPLDRPFTDERAMKLAEATENFHKWFATWDTIFSRQYPDTTFYRQSLQIQYLFAELYHEAIALRGVAGLDDASKIPESQRVVVERAIQSARQGLEICLRSPSYREGLKYAVTYTHLTAVFAASFLMRLARLFPQECEKLGGIESIFITVEELADLLSTIPATRYARTLRLMLSNRKRRLLPQKVQNSDSATHSGSDAASQQTLVSPQQQQAIPYIEGQMMYRPMHAHHRMMSGDSIYSSASSQVYVSQGTPRQYTVVPNRGHGVYPRPLDVVTPTEYQMFDTRPDQATPIWMTEDNLGDAGYGLETFILPQPFDSVIL